MVLICDVWLGEECGGTVVGEGVVIYGVQLHFVGLLFCVRLDFVGKPACSHICHLGIVGTTFERTAVVKCSIHMCLSHQ